MRKNLLHVFAFLLLITSCNRSSREELNQPEPPLKTAAEIDGIIRKSLAKNAEFNWNTAGDDVIWSAGQRTDKIFAVGFKPKSEVNVEERLHTIDIKEESWQLIKH